MSKANIQTIVRLQPEVLQVLKSEAKRSGESVSAYVDSLIRAQIPRSEADKLPERRLQGRPRGDSK